MRAEGDFVRLPSNRVEERAHFDTFFEEEHERLFKALYFVTGNRHDAEELMQGCVAGVRRRRSGGSGR
jgi:DNA-directed RNA polymerase specialized sigma24 family protein